MDNYDDESFDDGIADRHTEQKVEVGLWRRLAGYALAYPRELALIALFAFTTACMEVMFPLITKMVVDEVAARGEQARLLLYGSLYMLCTMLLAGGIGGFIWMAGKVRTHISHDIRRDAFQNLQSLSFSFFDHRPVGWLMARMTSDCDRLANILAWGFMDLVWGSTMMAGIAIAMLLMNPKLAFLALAILPVIAWVSRRFEVSILRSAREVRRTNSRITGAYNEAIMGVMTSKAFVREQDNARDFSGLTREMFDSSVANQTQAAIYVPLIITLGSLSTGLALALGGYDVLLGVISAGTLVAFLAYTRHFFDPIEELGHWFAEMQMAQASAERVLSLIDAQPQVHDRHPQQVSADDCAGRKIAEIKLQGVCFSYGSSDPVLKDISFSASAGDTIAIVGPTGGGKSTLVNLISRFYEPTSGRILLDGIDYRRFPLQWYQSNLGVVLQNAHLFSGSIRENIRYGRLDASDEEVIAAAKAAGADDIVRQMEHGYDSETGEGGSRLSAGQRQLVSFARAVLADPQVLVMDEATSSVDTMTEQRIQRGLENLLAGRISFVIAHRLSTIRTASRILVIEGGRIVESGNHAQLLAKRGAYYELYRQQSLREVHAAPALA